ncbi:hypothetical protein PAPYR_7184 [Paratrimastix pyriformis]|uniref:Uncharacterized protein n=1 Tax=Paratrimastix pyriformis TaxID=342808 RepID=A0ABQ8UG67_9EUKA|nr:hypothetical protein PAPYR_7184 [Paratrimastix pyriformis]
MADLPPPPPGFLEKHGIETVTTTLLESVRDGIKDAQTELASKRPNRKGAPLSLLYPHSKLVEEDVNLGSGAVLFFRFIFGLVLIFLVLGAVSVVVVVENTQGGGTCRTTFGSYSFFNIMFVTDGLLNTIIDVEGPNPDGFGYNVDVMTDKKVDSSGYLAVGFPLIESPEREYTRVENGYPYSTVRSGKCPDKQGSVYMFRTPPNTESWRYWTLDHVICSSECLNPTGSSSSDASFGATVVLYKPFIIIAAPNATSPDGTYPDAGRVCVFKRTCPDDKESGECQYTHQLTLTSPTPAISRHFGRSLGYVTDDMTDALTYVGVAADEGPVTLFKVNATGTQWTTTYVQPSQLKGPSISMGRKLLAVGAPTDNAGKGKVLAVFNFPDYFNGATLRPITLPLAGNEEPHTSTNFGQTLNVDAGDEEILVGEDGAIYSYVADGTTFVRKPTAFRERMTAGNATWNYWTMLMGDVTTRGDRLPGLGTQMESYSTQRQAEHPFVMLGFPDEFNGRGRTLLLRRGVGQGWELPNAEVATFELALDKANFSCNSTAASDLHLGQATAVSPSAVAAGGRGIVAVFSARKPLYGFGFYYATEWITDALLIIFIYWYKLHSMKYQDRHKHLQMSISDYQVMIKGLTGRAADADAIAEVMSTYGTVHQTLYLRIFT